ncbi:MAG: AMP-binding enzyme [Gammaproteobacteria bacterium]
MLEQGLASHLTVADVAVIAVADEYWQERPLAVVALRAGQTATQEALRLHLAEQVPRWWFPDRFEFMPTIPRTSVGKIDKRALRRRFG